MKRSYSDAHSDISPQPSRSQPKTAANDDGASREQAQLKKEAQDGHLPKISRKIRACKECQGRKVRCDGPGPTKKCARCQRLGLQCVVNKSLQTLLEDESEWKNDVDNKVEQLQAAVSAILQQTSMPPFESFSQVRPGTAERYSEHVHDHPVKSHQRGPSNTSPQDTISPRNRYVPGMAMTRENSPNPRSRDEPDASTLASAPMASLFEVTKLRNLRNNPNGRLAEPKKSWLEEDFISQGRVSLHEAEELFRQFDTSLNHYLWGGIALVHDNLEAVRRSSGVLAAAILAVTALHIPGKEDTFDTCYSEFLGLVADSMFDRYHSLDDVRGLCIGAFWLSDVSWKLSGHAVRIATELLLHQSFARAISGSTQHIERARLWYFLYVCDHHFSIAYGRPPVIHEDATITYHESFLQLPTSITNADYRLHSQVGVFIILTKIYHEFSDSSKPLTEESFKELRQYNYDLDMWRHKWEQRLLPNRYIASYPAKGVHLHFNFARLQLNSLALRTISHLSPSEMSAERREFANVAITAATTILDIVLNEPDIRKSVIGVPLYLHTNITFAATFLLKMQLQWRTAQLIGLDPMLIADLVGRVINLLNEARASDRHLAFHIAKGLTSMLAKFRERGFENNNGQAEQVPDAGMAIPMVNTPGSWNPSMGMGPPGAMYPETLDMFGLDAEYFPVGIFDALASQMPQ